MMRLTRAVVVEVRYDRIKLDSVVDGIVVTTDGFNIFKDKEKQALIRRLARECGIIILTDSDEAGFRIRRFVRDLAGDGEVLDAYIPDLPGKERRKSAPGKAGLLGVEGVPAEVLLQALEQCAVEQEENAVLPDDGRDITTADLYADGFLGTPGAAERRARFLKEAGFPTRLSTNAMLALLRRLMGYDGYRETVERLRAAQDQSPSQ